MPRFGGTFGTGYTGSSIFTPGMSIGAKIGTAFNVVGGFLFGISLMSGIAGWFFRNKEKSRAYKSTDATEKVSEDQPVPIVYGRNKVKGHFIHREDSASTVDSIETKFDAAVGFCEGEVSNIQDIQFEGKNVEDIGSTTYSTYVGSSTQAADTLFEAGVYVAPCVADAFISEESPDTVFQTDYPNYLFVSNYTAPGIGLLRYDENMNILVRFNISKLPANLNIKSAEIRLSSMMGSQVTLISKLMPVPIFNLIPAKHDLNGYLTSGANAETWDEETVTYNTAPGTGSAISGDCEIKPTRQFGFIFLNETGLAALRSAYNDSDETLSFWIKPSDTLRYLFGSKESGLESPALLVHYTEATPAAFRNTAYATLTIDNRAGVLTSRFPECTAIIDGLLITNWNTVTSAWQTTYNNNPAWELYDLLTNTRYGLGLSSSRINTDSFKTVAAYCDALITLPSGLTEKRYQCDIVLDEYADGEAAITAILSTFLGYIFFVDAKIHLGCEKSESSSHAFTTDNIILDSFSYGQIDKTEVPNIIRGIYIDPANDFKKAYVQVESEIDRSARDARILEVPLYGVHRKSQAERICRLMLWRGLLQEYTCSFRVSIQNCDVSVGDICSITHPLPNWTAKLFRVIETHETEDDEIEVNCVEYHDIVATAETAVPQTSYFYPDSGQGTYTERPAPSAPTWTLDSIAGGWRFEITSFQAGVNGYEIYWYNEDMRDWDHFELIFEKRREQNWRQEYLILDIYSPTPTVRTYGRFKIRTFGGELGNSDFSAEQNAWSKVKVPDSWTPSKPTLQLAGYYPSISRYGIANHYAFTITNKITCAAGEQDWIAEYNMRRRDDGGTGRVTWGNWKILPSKIIPQDPAVPVPNIIYYENTDRQFVPGYYYQYQVQAVGRTHNKVSGWSDTPAEILLTDDTTAPDQPTFTVTEQTGHNHLEIDTPTQSGGPCPDFDYFKIEGYTVAGGWVTLAAQWRGLTYDHPDIDSGLEINWSYRITAYDHSGNASTVSSTSGYVKMKKAGTTYLADSVVGTGTPGTLSDITVNAAGILLRVEKNDVINQINISTEGIDIEADNIVISGSCTFMSGYNPINKFDLSDNDADDIVEGATYGKMPKSWKNAVDATKIDGGYVYVGSAIVVGTGNNVGVISGADATYRIWAGNATAASAPFRVTQAGVLTATNAQIKSSPTDLNYIDINQTSNKGYVDIYGRSGASSSAKATTLSAVDGFGTYDYYGNLYVTASDVAGLGAAYGIAVNGLGILPNDDSCIVLPDFTQQPDWYFGASADPAIGFDYATPAIKVRFNNTTYTFSPD